ncbi:hypothetical protein, partial [Raoultella planticola]
MQWLDKALFEARAGSAETAGALLRTHEAAFAADPLKPWVGYAQGILAARSRKPEALAQLTPWIDARVAQCAQSAA